MTNLEKRKINMDFLYETMADMPQPLTPPAEAYFKVLKKVRESKPWNYFPLIVCYCCYIPDSKEIPTVKRGVSVPRPCAR